MLKNLEFLDLSYNKITEVDFQNIKIPKNLQNFALDGNPISKKHLAQLKKLFKK